MAQWYLDAQYQHPDFKYDYPEYYWTNAYSWLQTSATTPDSAYILALQDYLWHVIPDYTFLRNHVYYCPASGYVNHVGLGTAGSIAHTLTSPLWECAVLARFYTSGGVWCGYKRFRGPWSASILTSGVWPSSLVSSLQSALDSLLAAVPMCNHAGVSIGYAVVSSAVHIWQRRHGSKRAARLVIAG